MSVLESEFKVQPNRWSWKPTIVFCSTRKSTSDTAS